MLLSTSAANGCILLQPVGVTDWSLKSLNVCCSFLRCSITADAIKWSTQNSFFSAFCILFSTSAALYKISHVVLYCHIRYLYMYKGEREKWLIMCCKLAACTCLACAICIIQMCCWDLWCCTLSNVSHTLLVLHYWFWIVHISMCCWTVSIVAA
jgi:hypothetical protein